MFDVVVIGGGLAGCIAAMAARAQGAKVALASRSFGATAMSTGAVDIAYEPALPVLEQRTLFEQLHDIVLHRPRHPYGVLKSHEIAPALSKGHALLRSMLAPAQIAPPALDLQASNVALASSLGGLIAAAGALEPASGLDFSHPRQRPTGVLQLRGYGGFDAHRICLGLTHDARHMYGMDSEFVVVSVSWDGPTHAHAMAVMFDDEAVTDTLARQLRFSGLGALLVPPVLGLNRHHAARKKLSEAAEVPVVETLAHLPSVPGVRLQQALLEAVRAAKITEIGEVKTPVVQGKQIRALETVDGLTVHAGAFVLATGRFIAGGITWEQRCREALFGLPVVTDLGWLEHDSPLAVVRETPVDSHPLMTAGVKVDSDLHPILEDRVAYTNLFAAGMIIGGFASRYALCADGVSLATGFLAGERAARAAASH